MQHTYLAIDLKSYYASAECASRHLDPLTTNLVVADASRTEKTICLAVSPSLKACGIPGRARLFEVVQKVKEVNAERLRNAIRNHTAVYKDGKPSLSSKSYDAVALAKDPSLEVDYLVAPPRMLYYEKVSRQIYSIYQKYIAPEDILGYRQVLCANSFTSLAELSLHRAGKPALNYLVAEDREHVKGGEAACEALDVSSVFCYQPASSSCISMCFMLMYFFPPHWVPAT